VNYTGVWFDRGNVFPFPSGRVPAGGPCTSYWRKGRGGCATWPRLRYALCSAAVTTNKPHNMSRSNVLVALAAGAALGAIAGILFAPASGKETRNKLMKRGEKLRGQLTDLVDQGKELVDEAKGQMKDAASQAGTKVREASGQAKSEYSSGQSGSRNSGSATV
jgi:gas vesicle protein